MKILKSIGMFLGIITETSKPNESISKPKRVRKESTRVTKHAQVRSHLLQNGSITSWEAIDYYGATRLSAIIYRLRNNGYDIESIPLSALDRNNNTSNFVRYVLHQH